MFVYSFKQKLYAVAKKGMTVPMKKVTWCVIYQFTNLPIAFKIVVVSISNKVAFSTKNFTFQTKPKYIPNLVFAAKKLGKSHHASVVCVPTHLWFLLNCILKRMSLSEISGWYSNCSSIQELNNSIFCFWSKLMEVIH